MSFVDQDRGMRPASVAAVVLVHVVIGYAVISGLAVRVFTSLPPVTLVHSYKEDPPPPPPTKETPPPRTSSRPDPTPLQPIKVDRIVSPPTTGEVTVTQIPAGSSHDDGFSPPPRTDPPPRPSLGRGVSVVGDRGSWVTTADYPASAARIGAEGTTAILVAIAADGHATDCRVTASSGNEALDQAACRTYLRRARFRPALDVDGHPIASELADRIRWVLPME